MPMPDIKALREAVDDARNAGWTIAVEAEIKLLASVPALLDRIEALEGRLREWQLGVGDTEMEARARRAETDLAIARSHECVLYGALDAEIAKRARAEIRAECAEAELATIKTRTCETCRERRHLLCDRLAVSCLWVKFCGLWQPKEGK